MLVNLKAEEARLPDGKNIRIETRLDFSITFAAMAAEPPRYEPGRPIVRFCCGEPMKLVKFVPRIGAYAELQTYQCDRCHNLETIEVEWGYFQPRRLS